MLRVLLASATSLAAIETHRSAHAPLVVTHPLPSSVRSLSIYQDASPLTHPPRLMKPLPLPLTRDSARDSETLLLALDLSPQDRSPFGDKDANALDSSSFPPMRRPKRRIDEVEDQISVSLTAPDEKSIRHGKEKQRRDAVETP